MNIRFFANRYWKRRQLLMFTRHHDKRAASKLLRLLALLAVLIIIHSIAMIFFEGMSVSDALWLSITTTTTVGYGDYSAGSWQGRIATTIFIYLFAISLLAQLAAEFFEYRFNVREDKYKGNWVWKNMNNHLLIINTPDQNTDTYMERFISQIRATPQFRELPIQILSTNYSNGLPGRISQLGVVHYNAAAEDNSNLQAANISQADYIIILAKNSNDTLSDSLTFDVLSRIQEIGSRALIAVECTVDSNRNRMKKAGAQIVIRPIRAYPELMVRAIAEPGTETVMENLFTLEDDYMQRINFSFSKLRWRDMVMASVKNDFGLPLAYIDDEGVYSNPPPDQYCTGNAIISLVRDDQNLSEEAVARCLKAGV